MKFNKKAVLAFLLLRLKRKRRRQQRGRAWRKAWISKHDEQGAYYNLVRELGDSDRRGFNNFLRVSGDVFQDLLIRIQPAIEKKNTKFRSAVSVGERLAVTLRFLATGMCLVIAPNNKRPK